MSETIATLVFIILAILFYKMIGRYVGIPLVLGACGAVIGAIFGSKGAWINYAYIGAIIGVVVCLVIDFDNVWKTILGACLGGGIGWLVGLLVSSAMWSSVVCLAGALVGACIINPTALEDITRGSSKNYSRPSNSSSGSAPYKDANGNEKSYVAHYCCQCNHYNTSSHTCMSSSQYIDPYTPSCSAFTRS